MKYILRFSTLIILNIIVLQAGDLFRHHLKNIVYDSKTFLYWQDTNPTHVGGLQDSIEYCEERDLGGYTDWRLPNINELFSLVDYSKKNPSIKESKFINVESVSYWSSTNIHIQGASLYKAISFEDGSIGVLSDMQHKSAIRCVRGGHKVQSPTLISPSSITLGMADITPIVFTNSGGTPNNCIVTNLPNGLTASIDGDNCVITGRPLQASEEIIINMKVDNASGEHNVSIGMTINLSQPDIENKSEFNTIVRTSTSIVFNNLSGNPSSCTATNLPTGLNVKVFENTCAITGFPINETSKKTITITATNSQGSDTATIDIAVNLPTIGNLRTGKISSLKNKDDGYYKRGLSRSFTRNNTKKVVIDNLKNLMWQDDTNDNNRTHNEANTYCNNLTLGDYTNWKLPTIKELNTIVDRGRAGLAINTIFQNAINKWYWSSSVHKVHSDSFWSVYFYSGQVAYAIKTNTYIHTRCVRDNN